MSKRLVLTFVGLFIICLAVMRVEAQPYKYTFTYQGKLTDNGAPANGNYDLKFALFDSATGDFEARPPQTVTNVPVVNGVFTVNLYFGATAFVGPPRFLEISARPTGTGAFTLLNPRQPINPAPYASYSYESAFAERTANADLLGGVAAGQYVQTNDARLSDARAPAAGSGNYIQNSSSAQADANFNISGDGKAGGTLSANAVNAVTQYNISGTRAFSLTAAGDGTLNNTFAGAGAGASNTPGPASGDFNSFFGHNVGAANTTGRFNSFFGASAGSQNTGGVGNSFFGMRAGSKNTTGSQNSFFGSTAGDFNTTGNFNSFFGASAGRANTTGANNIFVGPSAGSNNISGSFNTFVGLCAGCANGFGSHNAFFGENAGTSNGSENYNTFIGANANGGPGTGNSTAIGAYAKVTEPNAVVLGSINGVNGATADTRVGIGTTAPTYKLQIFDPANKGLRVQTNTSGGAVASFGGLGDFSIDADSFPGGRMNVKESGDIGFGIPFPTSRFHFVDPANRGLRVQTNTAGGTVASFGGLGDFNVDSNGDAGGRFIVKENGNTGIGTNIPSAKLDVNGNVKIATFGSGGNTSLCKNNVGEVALCSSSLRYKTSLRPFRRGLNLINQLHPLTFRWKSDQSNDLGLGAEDVAAVEPLLVTHNANGEVEGVKYDRVAVVLINAVKEQQAQIERQQAEIAELKKLVCKSRRHAGVCK